jgi:hypothetical protein
MAMGMFMQLSDGIALKGIPWWGIKGLHYSMWLGEG